jgi:hypothetical protein
VVAGSAWHLERAAWCDDVQATLRVKHVADREQIPLVGAAPVMEHEQAGRRRCGGALQKLERGHRARRLPSRSMASKFARTLAKAGVLRKLPVARLLAVAELALLAREHIVKLEPHERRRLRELVVHGHGRPSNLTERERGELAMLVAKLDPKLFARTALKKLNPIKL